MLRAIGPVIPIECGAMRNLDGDLTGTIAVILGVHTLVECMQGPFELGDFVANVCLVSNSAMWG